MAGKIGIGWAETRRTPHLYEPVMRTPSQKINSIRPARIRVNIKFVYEQKTDKQPDKKWIGKVLRFDTFLQQLQSVLSETSQVNSF
jgi:hypothetical protein